LYFKGISYLQCANEILTISAHKQRIKLRQKKMKFINTPILTLLAMTVFTGTVNAKNETNMDLVTDKATTMALIQESLAKNKLTIEKADFSNEVKELLAQKPYMPKPRFFARNNDSRSTTLIESEE